jgi:hypothetical protein
MRVQSVVSALASSLHLERFGTYSDPIAARGSCGKTCKLSFWTMNFKLDINESRDNYFMLLLIIMHLASGQKLHENIQSFHYAYSSVQITALGHSSPLIFESPLGTRFLIIL